MDIVNLLCPAGAGLTVVGDDAQAVYGFRGADSRHLLGLAATLPDARTVCLEQNFRSRQRILAFANEVRPSAGGVALRLRSDRDGGPRPRLVRCHDASAEARLVVDRVLAAHEQGRPLRSQAVLMRAAHHSDLLEVELTARRVPFVKYGGLKFLEAAHVKDFIATVRLLDNPLDEIAWYRLLRLHDGVGPARARACSTPAPGRAHPRCGTRRRSRPPRRPGPRSPPPWTPGLGPPAPRGRRPPPSSRPAAAAADRPVSGPPGPAGRPDRLGGARWRRWPTTWRA